MVGIALRFKMDIGLVMRNPGRLDGLVAHLFRQLLEGVVGFLGDEVALFQPAFGPGRRAHPGKTAVASQHLHRFAIFYAAGFVVNRRHLVAQEGLGS